MDLLAKLWRDLDDSGRGRLGELLLAGPPDALPANIDSGERPVYRDRRIFSRIIVLERVREPPLTPALQRRMDELRSAYPDWRAEDGERAHFSVWFGLRPGPDTLHGVDDLAAMPDNLLAETLRADQPQREGLLDSWRKLVIAQPERCFDLLEKPGDPTDPWPADIWQRALWGLRDAENARPVTDRVVALLGEAPDALFEKRDVVKAAADLLEARSRALRDETEPQGFWTLFDRVATAACSEEIDGDHNDKKDQHDWVDRSINCSLGCIATAFFNALFARHPPAGDRLPGDLIQRATLLMSLDRESHRPARVIGASRASYLHAIDPGWTSENLLPAFDWTNEEESIAMWQGYAWGAVIDPQLWAALKGHFLELFRRDRLERLGTFGRNIAQSLMLAGIEFDAGQLKRMDVCNAIRSMPEDMRKDAAEWIAGYMQAVGDDNSPEDEPIEGSPDHRWNTRIWPWIKSVWPAEETSRSPDVSEQFALAVMETDKAFPEAVDNIERYTAAKEYGYQLICKLNASNHPDKHPEAALKLLDACVAKSQMLSCGEDLGQVIQRLGATNEVNDDNRYRQWESLVVQAQH